LHWDGKLLRVLTSIEQVARLPIIVNGNGVSQQLQVAILPNGTGMLQVKAVAEALSEWNLKEAVVAMSFDSTSSNNGRNQGVCVLLERELEKDLLYLACRHHVLELLAQTAFHTVMGSTAAPEVVLFKRFQTQWEFFDKTQFSTIASDQKYAEIIIDSDLIAWAENPLRIGSS